MNSSIFWKTYRPTNPAPSLNPSAPTSSAGAARAAATAAFRRFYANTNAATEEKRPRLSPEERAAQVEFIRSLNK